MPDMRLRGSRPHFPLPAAFCVWVAGALFLVSPALAQEPLSGPVSGSLSDPIYQESNQTGPSTFLFLGDNSLQNPYIRTGISDPLGYLIESGDMSPFVAGGELNDNYADSDARSQVQTDSTLTERFSEYRDNHALMGGAGSSSILAARASSAGSSNAARTSGATAPGAAASAFSAITMRAPFAAGSMASRQAASATGGNGFLDPNMLVAAASSSSALSGGQMGSGPGGSIGASTDVPGATIYSADATGAISDVFATTVGGMPGEIPVPPANGTVAGPAAGEVFPDVSMVMPSGTGFPDSTMGTAGPPMERLDTSSSPLSASWAGSSDSPFRSLNSPTSRFLEPSLAGGEGDASGGMAGGGESAGPGGMSFSEVRRKARLHAMIYNPGGEMPSPFEQRAMERAYRKQNSGRHVPHQPKLMVQSGNQTH